MCMVSCISLWCSSPQDECMFNTLPYYITDLFITAYMYSKVIESLNNTIRCCKQWNPMYALLIQSHQKPSNLIHVKLSLLANFLQSLKTLQSCFPLLHFQESRYKVGDQTTVLYFVSAFTVGQTTAGWIVGPRLYPFIDLDHGRKCTKWDIRLAVQPQ